MCGYERADGYWDDNNFWVDKEIGDEDFEKIEGNYFFIKGDYYGGKREVYLYACPKCNTIQMKKEYF